MIHRTAVVEADRRIPDSAEIGPFAFIGRDVSIGERVVVGAHAVIEGSPGPEICRRKNHTGDRSENCRPRDGQH